MTIDEAKKLIENDAYIPGLIQQVDLLGFKSCLKGKHVPKIARNSAFERFWASLNDAEFRRYFDINYGVNLNNTRDLGVIKTAIRLVYGEFKDREG